MTTPIACTLTSRQSRERITQLAALAGRALRVREPIDGGERLTFTAGPGVDQELHDAVAAEASCCSFLTMRLERTDGAFALDITGPAEARPIIAQLFA
jgi:hypothetical protein